MKRRNEGFIITDKGKVWYEIIGDSNSIPLLTLHGGPGFPHDSIESLEDLADERNIIFYDQLGCGNSERTTDKSQWTVDYFVSELQTVVKKLGLKQYHILGQSWGAALGVTFALTNPKGIKSLTLSSPYLSTPQWEKDVEKLLNQFPKAMQIALKRGDDKSEEYKKASDEFFYRHISRIDKLPTGNLKARHKKNVELYTYMWGPKEFNPIGTLKNFDLSNKLHKINVPVLLMCGRFDEASPESTKYFQSLIPNAKMEVFEKSAHMAHWTEREKYIKTVRDFLQDIG